MGEKNEKLDANPEFPLDTINAVAELSGWVITTRSGLADILSHTPCRLTVLYPSGKWLGGTLMEGTSLNKMGLRENAEEYTFLEDQNFIKSVIFEKKFF